ncbi:MAG: hypothetical protein LUQ65_00625 [Candidatus Helarchaeota archaeon]|nr:hypothetical protein [Candidatus Helarchaeota archaeon]
MRLRDISSHYGSFLIKCPFEQIFEHLNTLYGTVYRKQFGKLEELRTGVIVGEAILKGVATYKKSDTAITFFLEELSPIDTQIEIIAYAGGTGLYSNSRGRHSKFVHYVIDSLKEQGFKVESFKEESRYEGK